MGVNVRWPEGKGRVVQYGKGQGGNGLKRAARIHGHSHHQSIS